MSERLQAEKASPVTSRTSLLAYIYPAGISLLLLAHCVNVSAKKPFWFDEMLTYHMAADADFSHMFAGIRSYFNSLPPLYSVLLWIWARAFGTSELALRLPSSLCFAGAFWILWLTLRPRWGTTPAFLGIAAALTSHFLGYNAEARAYGLYLFFCALTIYQFAAFASQPNRSKAFYAANTLFHAGMVLTHLFGFLYSASLLIVVFCLDVKKRRFSAAMYGSVFLAWSLFALLWLKTTLYQMGAFKPYSWVSVPRLHDLVSEVLVDGTRMLPLIAIGLVACMGLAWLARRQSRLTALAAHSDDWRTLRIDEKGAARPLAFLAALFLVFPPAVAYVISHAGASIFVDRYFIPSILAWAILLTLVAAELQFRLSAWQQTGKGPLPQRILGGAAMLLLVVLAVKTVHRNDYSLYGPDFATLHENQNIPIVCEDNLYFLPHAHYSPNRSRYFFLLDEEAVLHSAPAKIGWGMVKYRAMRGLHEHYPAITILDWRAFLRAHHEFLIVVSPASRWSELRILSDPKYACTESIEEGYQLIWVRPAR